MPTYVIDAAAGFGKTELAVEHIAHSDRTPYEVYVPTIKLAVEWRDRIIAINPSKCVTIIRGRAFTSEREVALCKKFKLADALSDAHLPVFPNLCRKKGKKDQPPIKCEHYDQCAYIAQFQHAEVYIYTHAYLPLRRTGLEIHRPYGVVIDESFWNTCVKSASFPLRLLTHPDLPVEAQPLCTKIATAIVHAPCELVSILQAADDSGEYIQAVRAFRAASNIVNPAMSAKAIKAELKRIQSFFPVEKMLSQLYRESNFDRPIQSVVYDHETGAVAVHYRMPINRFKGAGLRAVLDNPMPILILDASASPSIISRLFDIKEYEKLSLKRNANVLQCISSRCSKTSITPASNSDQTSKAAARRKLADIQHLIDSWAPRCNGLLVVGPSAVVGNSRTKVKPLLNCPAGAEFAHFNALRGRDAWRDFEVVIVIGRNQPRVTDIENISRALFFDDREPLRLSGQLTEETRGYSYVDGEVGVEVQVHADPRVQGVHEQIREHESQQALDRLRLIHNQEMKTIILLSNLPLDIDVDELRTWDEVIHGGNRIEQAYNRQENGILPLNAKWLTANYPDLWPTEAAAKKDVGRKRGQTPNINTISKMSPFAHEYKPPHQRAWSRCLSRFADPETVAKALRIALGWPVSVKPTLSVNDT